MTYALPWSFGYEASNIDDYRMQAREKVSNVACRPFTRNSMAQSRKGFAFAHDSQNMVPRAGCGRS